MDRFYTNPNEPDFLEKSLTFIRDFLEKKKLSRSYILKTELLAEETIVLLVKHASEGARLHIHASAFLGDISLELSMKGEAFELTSEKDIGLYDVEEDHVEDAIRNIFLHSYGESYKYSHDNNSNKFRILVEKSGKQSLYTILLAILLGVLCGILIRNFAPTSVGHGISRYLLDPVKTMFMNALNIVIGPVIFFSLITCISQFKNIAELGKVAAKIMTFYLVTTVIAVTIGFAVTSLAKPGNEGFALSSDVTYENASDFDYGDENISLIDTVVNIVPNNLISPLMKNDTLQIMFLAILIGIVMGMIGEYAVTLRGIFEACNTLFLTLTTLITKLIPLAVFASVSLLLINSGMGIFRHVLAEGITLIATMFLMMSIYGLLLLVIGRINPVRFFNNLKESMVTGFTLCSSSAAIPTNLETSTKKLGITPSLGNFTIPLGATLNMDGCCIFLSSGILFLMRAYGAKITMSQILPLILTIILLSLSSPGVPGNGIVCLSIVIAQTGLPMEAVGLLMPIYPIMDMFITVNNTTGDLAGTLLVAKSEGKADMDVFYGRKKI
ncbi:dicarboxylate/amino acid:cation symporter [Butyrivibrio sp. NC2002]|uniref:dicarboxylate/amino acid:cation symporter n=1 Tax=Butyrivibrio sp. NC2002 TaxID=1410610 RepID=UPI00056470B6|nr:dicarboxylate/amino acid:cation symporter [Butyrivibrio sp. NC2002]